MNCTDIALILDDGDACGLESGRQRAVETHLATCPGCASQWRMHAGLAAKRLPAIPADLVEDCRNLAVSVGGNVRRRAQGRFALVAGIVAIAAAAATIAVYHADPAQSPAIASVPPSATDTPESVVGVAPSVKAPGFAEPKTATVPESRRTAAPVSPIPELRTLVHVLPLQNDGANAGSRAAIDAFYMAVVDRLRGISSVDLRMTDGAATTGQADYEITITGSETSQQQKVLGRVLVRKKLGGSGVVLPVQAEFEKDCGDPSSCFDSSTAAKNIVGALERMLMPSGESQQRVLQTQVLDRTLPPVQRLEALRKLAAPRVEMAADRFSMQKPQLVRDPAILDAVIELAGKTADPAARAELWRMSRNVGNGALIDPLIAAARDPASSVRNEVVTTLAKDFAGDPRVRTALEEVARLDADPQIRELARRALQQE